MADQVAGEGIAMEVEERQVQTGGENVPRPEISNSNENREEKEEQGSLSSPPPESDDDDISSTEGERSPPIKKMDCSVCSNPVLINEKETNKPAAIERRKLWITTICLLMNLKLGFSPDCTFQHFPFCKLCSDMIQGIVRNMTTFMPQVIKKIGQHLERIGLKAQGSTSRAVLPQNSLRFKILECKLKE